MRHGQARGWQPPAPARLTGRPGAQSAAALSPPGPGSPLCAMRRPLARLSRCPFRIRGSPQPGPGRPLSLSQVSSRRCNGAGRPHDRVPARLWPGGPVERILKPPAHQSLTARPVTVIIRAARQCRLVHATKMIPITASALCECLLVTAARPVARRGSWDDSDRRDGLKFYSGTTI